MFHFSAHKKRYTLTSLAASARESHPNRVPFQGVLAVVGKAGDRAPKGAREHRIKLTPQAAEDALPSLLGMAVNFHPDWNTHDARNKCGVITGAHIEGRRLHVSGYLYGLDFPEVIDKDRRLGG